MESRLNKTIFEIIQGIDKQTVQIECFGGKC